MQHRPTACRFSGPGPALRLATSSWILTDFVGDPAYDLGVALRDWCPQLLAGDATLLAREYCRLLASGSGLDETPIWEWGFLERVSTGLYALSLGAERLAFPLLRSAEAYVGARAVSDPASSA